MLQEELRPSEVLVEFSTPMTLLEPEELMPKNSLLDSTIQDVASAKRKPMLFLPTSIPTKMVMLTSTSSSEELEDPQMPLDKSVLMLLSPNSMSTALVALLLQTLELHTMLLLTPRLSAVTLPRMRLSLSSYPTSVTKTMMDKSLSLSGMITTLPYLLLLTTISTSPIS